MIITADTDKNKHCHTMWQDEIIMVGLSTQPNGGTDTKL